MIKFLILISIAICLVKSQNPIPVPRLNASSLDGLWWVQWQYFADPKYSPSSYQCYNYNISVGDNTLDVHWDSIYLGDELSGDVAYTTGSTPAQWFISPIDGYNKTILAYDYLHGQWFLIGDNDYDWALLFARTQSPASPIQVEVAINLLLAEGYNVTSAHSASYNNTNCKNSIYGSLIF
jgi:hypothetical protein